MSVNGQFDAVTGTFSMNNESKNLANSQCTIDSVYTVDSDRNLVGVKSKSALLKKRPTIHPLVIVLLVLSFIALITAVIVISVLYSKSRIILCDSEECLRISASLKAVMNTSADPCEDFYQYACGRWMNSHSAMCPTVINDQEHDWFKETNDAVIRNIKELLHQDLTGEKIPWSVKEAKTLYMSCLDQESWDDLGLLPIFSLLKELNMTEKPPIKEKSETDVILQAARVKRVLGSDVLFGAFADYDPRNSSKYIITLASPQTSNPFPSNSIVEKRLKLIKKQAKQVSDDTQEIDEEEEQNVNKTLWITKKYMSEVMKYVLSNGSIDHYMCSFRQNFSDSITDDELEEAIDKVLEFSDLIEEVTHSYSNNSIDQTVQKITDKSYILLDELQNITDEYVKSMNESLAPRLLWKPFLQELFNGIEGFNSNEKILVMDYDYLKETALILSVVDDKVLEIYLWWKVVDYSAPFLTKEIRVLQDEYLSHLMPGDWKCQRYIHCASNVNELMGMAIAWLYIKPNFMKDGPGKNVEEMLENIKLSFSKFVKEATWMDEQTKSVTLEKNNKMTSQIGYPKWLFEEGKLDTYYEGLNMSVDQYFENMIQILRLGNDNALKQIFSNDTDDERDWSITPTEVNALHTFQTNEITVPVAILQFPFYGLGIEALNYGAVGSVLGHELTHGFDNTGRLFDSEGNMKQWWTNDTITRYTNISQCFIDQYDKYYEEPVDEYVDGLKTLGENLADNGGLREAYNAYQLWKKKHKKEPLLPGFTDFTHDQLLFLGYAHMWCESYTVIGLKWMLDDNHSPGHVRLRTVLKNSKEFSKAWKCPSNSNMNPKQKCQLW